MVCLIAMSAGRLAADTAYPLFQTETLCNRIDEERVPVFPSAAIRHDGSTTRTQGLRRKGVLLPFSTLQVVRVVYEEAWLWWRTAK